MIREHLFEKRLPTDPLFRWRGGAVSRIEGFSDGVFAIILALLVVATSVPDSFYELWLLIRDLPVFLITFAFVMMCWHDHYIYFRRYGLEDAPTKLLNAAFLFLIAFFAFPLKFLATFLWHIIIGLPRDPMFALPEGVEATGWLATDLGQRSAMMVFYGLGCCGVYAVLWLMVWRAWRARQRLELDELEQHLTKVAMHHHMVMVLVSVLSVIVLFWTGQPGLSGVVYFLLGPIHAVLGVLGGMKTHRLSQAVSDS